MRLPPRSPEGVLRDERLHLLIQKAVEAHNALSPVDKAIAYVQQRNSFARGNISIDGEWTEAHQSAIDSDYATVLMNEVIRLRSKIVELREKKRGSN